MMLWNNQAVADPVKSVEGLFCRHSFIDGMIILKKSISGDVVLLDRHCIEKVTGHLRQSTSELGGLLLGSVFTNGSKSLVVEVMESVPSSTFQNSAVSLRMDPEVWSRASRKMDQSGHTLVGWYHSHPNLGAFFSGTDRISQRNFFYNKYSVGLVVDPILEQQKIFIGPSALEVETTNVLVI